jgi:hypothetical protein
MTKIEVTITTYNRKEKLFNLLSDIEKEKNYNVKVRVFDDCSNENLNLNCFYYRFKEHKGKNGYWEIINKAFKVDNADYYFFLPDDVRLCENFFDRAINQFDSINDSNKICLNLLLDKSRIGKASWTGFKPVMFLCGDYYVYKTQWIDMCFIAKKKFFSELEYKILPVGPSRWNSNNRLGSGLGDQISTRLNNKGLNIYQVVDTLVFHSNHDSKMFSGSSKNVTRDREKIIFSGASIPERKNELKKTIDSIKPQCDLINICLNNYDSIPNFLKDDKISAWLGDNKKADGEAYKYIDKNKGYNFIFGDDLIYPKGYVDYLINKIEHYHRKAVVSLHGRVFPTFPIWNYYRSSNCYHCLRDLKHDVGCHIIGTGGVGFHSSTLKLSYNDFKDPFMADVWFSLAAQKQGIPLIVVKHNHGWLKYQSSVGEKTIFNMMSTNKNKLVDIINNHTWKSNFISDSIDINGNLTDGWLKLDKSEVIQQKKTKQINQWIKL